MSTDGVKYWGGTSGRAFSTGPPIPVAPRKDIVLPDGYVIRRHRPRLAELAKPEMRWRALPPTAPDDHLHSMDALRIRDPSGNVSGDWHKESNWSWIALVDHPAESAPTSRDDSLLAGLNDVFGTERVVEVRQYFVDLKHPDADRYTHVWASAHERAVVELAWRRVQVTGTISGRAFPLRARCRWVPSGDRRDWCLQALDRLGDLLTGQAQAAWRQWNDEWRYATSDEEPYLGNTVATDE